MQYGTNYISASIDTKIDKNEFRSLLAAYYEQEPKSMISSELANMFIKIALGLSKRINYSQYSNLCEMQSDSIFRMQKATFERKFDLARTDKNGKLCSIYGYYYMIGNMSFIQCINKMKHRLDIRDNYRTSIEIDLPIIYQNQPTSTKNNKES